MDGGSQVRRVATLAVGTATWLRDEEANGPARVAHHSTIRTLSCPAFFGQEIL
jgi:hypothetical protein